MVMRPASDAVVERAAASIHMPRDPNTLANYNAWRTQHTTANYEIDFEKKRLHGSVTLTLKKLADERKIVLDTSYLDVSAVTIAGKKVDWELAAKRTEPYGSALTIALSEEHVASNSQLSVGNRGLDDQRLHRTPMDDACPDQQQEAAVHVLAMPGHPRQVSAAVPRHPRCQVDLHL